MSINLSFDYYFKEIVIKMKGRVQGRRYVWGYWVVENLCAPVKFPFRIVI